MQLQLLFLLCLVSVIAASELDLNPIFADHIDIPLPVHNRHRRSKKNTCDTCNVPKTCKCKIPQANQMINPQQVTTTTNGQVSTEGVTGTGGGSGQRALNSAVFCAGTLDANIKCPDQRTIKVQWSNFGNSDPAETCISSYPDFMRNKLCDHSKKDTKTLAKMCDESRSCTFSATDATFGGHCGMSAKYLELSYTCKA